MDGNGRWAEKRNHGRFFGHIRGAKTAKAIVNACVEKGLKNLTLFIFSRENWYRPQEEVNILIRLLEKHLRKERDQFMKNNIRFSCIGELYRLPQSTLFEIKELMKKTNQNTGMNLVFALSYSGRHEIVSATKKLIQKVKNEELKLEDVSEEELSRSLDSSFLPDPDLIIRTSGENRLSNFFLWQVAYSEIYFCEKYWPDFSFEDLNKALLFFSKKERRFGKLLQKEKESLATIST